MLSASSLLVNKVHVSRSTFVEKQELCLHGRPDGSWDLNPPEQDVPPELPDPVVGINYARDEMPEKQWISYIAAQSDAWLVYVAFFMAARIGFDKDDRYKKKKWFFYSCLLLHANTKKKG